MSEINRRLDHKKFGYLRIGRNILFFDGDVLEANILASNPVLKSVDMKRKLPHKIILDIVEREPAGIWCAGLRVGSRRGEGPNEVGTPQKAGNSVECRYFDKEMNTWGPAARSSGFLFLTIEDMRSREKFNIEEDFFRSINEVAGGLPGLTVKTVTIPENSFDEFRVYTDKGFYVVFSLDSDLKNQLEVLRIFLAEKAEDLGFNPQYIDLRIDGRVYFK